MDTTETKTNELQTNLTPEEQEAFNESVYAMKDYNHVLAFLVKDDDATFIYKGKDSALGAAMVGAALKNSEFEMFILSVSSNILREKMRNYLEKQ